MEQFPIELLRDELKQLRDEIHSMNRKIDEVKLCITQSCEQHRKEIYGRLCDLDVASATLSTRLGGVVVVISTAVSIAVSLVLLLVQKVIP